MAVRYELGAKDEFPSGTRQIVELGGRSIGIFNVDGRFFALKNVCPHHGAPLCFGPVEGRMLDSKPHEYLYGEENSVIRCPWHGYEFRIEDGRSITDPKGLRVKAYEVAIEEDNVVLYV